MPKPLKFYQTLNQPARNPRYGQHRRPGTTPHRDSIDRAGDGAGGTITWHTFGPAFWSSGTNTPADQGAGKNAGLTAQQIATAKGIASLGFYRNILRFGVDPGLELEPLPTVVTTGEIIGHRQWWLINGHLYSIAHERRWEPGGVMTGDVDKVEDTGNLGGGVYSYSGAACCNDEAAVLGDRLDRLSIYWLMWASCLPDRHRFILNADAIVTGTVKLWGQVVEHQHGYRAQFARIASLDAIHVPGYCKDDAPRWLEELIRRYQV